VKSVLQIGCLIDATEDKDLYLAKSWIAQYAYIRNWWNKGQKTEIDKAINAVVVSENPVDDEKKVKDLLNTREFVVLQGAPGTGKTFLANKIGKLYDELYFIQFHGETTYSLKFPTPILSVLSA
jgi:5-methylcytosine-specific restriction protein B